MRFKGNTTEIQMQLGNIKGNVKYNMTENNGNIANAKEIQTQIHHIQWIHKEYKGNAGNVKNAQSKKQKGDTNCKGHMKEIQS